MLKQAQDIYLPFDAEIIKRTQESSDIFTLTLKLSDANRQEKYAFVPGQFNMLYLFGVGEIACSIISDPMNTGFFTHTVRSVGRVTQGLALLKAGDFVGIRGPFGHGWPLEQAQGKDVLIITGGLGCAPSVSVIKYIVNRRSEFGRLIILQGVKHSDDLIFRQQYEAWEKLQNTQVLLAADIGKPSWLGYTGLVTELIDKIDLDVTRTICLLCGPEAMMCASVDRLSQLKLPEASMYLSLERNMECAVGHCGHCQFGGQFICKDGPIFCYPDIKPWLGQRGF